MELSPTGLSAASETTSTTDPAGTGRRRFLQRAGAAGAGILAGPAIGAASARAAWLHQPAAAPKTADWAALRQHLSTHRLFRPGQSGYGQARELFDPRFDRLRPAGVAYCRTPADVAACVTFASRFKLPIRARSGGHSYAGWSSVTGGLVVDVSALNSFTVGSGTVRVGTGLALIDFYSKLSARGVVVPGGSCPTVGIAGLTLGGGVGVLGRRYGLASDNLLAVQLVTASGEVLNCTPSQNADLLWACQGGGGGNFGIATSFTLRTHPLRNLVLFFMSWPWADAARVVNAWQHWAPHAPDALWANMHLSAAPGGRVPVLGAGGTYVGSVAGASQQLQKLFANAGQPGSLSIREHAYLDAMLLEAGCSGLSVPQCHTGPSGRLGRVPAYAKSDFFAKPLNAAGISALLHGVEHMLSVRGAAGGAGSVAFDAFGGAINRIRPDATAFVHRKTLFLAQYYTSWRFPGSHSGVDAQRQWLRSTHAAVHPHASGGAYQNYIDTDLADWRQAYYGTNYARLSRIKARYDPHQLFKFPQGITPPS